MAKARAARGENRTNGGALYLDRGLFTSPVYLGLCLTEAEFNAEIANLKLDPGKCSIGHWVNNATARTWTFHKTGPGAHTVALVCLPDLTGLYPAEVVAIIAHEVQHVWQSICEQIGEDKPSDEFEAYCIQMLMAKYVDAYLAARPMKVPTAKQREARSG